jgi:CRISPR/Cas system-associated endoribonuclease Cas2
MKCYIILYDLKVPGRNYQQLYDAIQAYGTWGKISESAWAIVTTQNTTEIRDNLTKYIDSNDRLFVIKSGKEAAWRNSIADIDWLKKFLILG